jgi:hypothetical protein
MVATHVELGEKKRKEIIPKIAISDIEGRNIPRAGRQCKLISGRQRTFIQVNMMESCSVNGPVSEKVVHKVNGRLVEH